MKRKCRGEPPKCGPKPQSWLNKVDLMAGFVSLGIVCLCAYTLAIVMLLVNGG